MFGNLATGHFSGKFFQKIAGSDPGIALKRSKMKRPTAKRSTNEKIDKWKDRKMKRSTKEKIDKWKDRKMKRSTKEKIDKWKDRKMKRSTKEKIDNYKIEKLVIIQRTSWSYPKF